MFNEHFGGNFGGSYDGNFDGNGYTMEGEATQVEIENSLVGISMFY